MKIQFALALKSVYSKDLEKVFQSMLHASKKYNMQQLHKELLIDYIVDKATTVSNSTSPSESDSNDQISSDSSLKLGHLALSIDSNILYSSDSNITTPSTSIIKKSGTLPKELESIFNSCESSNRKKPLQLSLYPFQFQEWELKREIQEEINKLKRKKTIEELELKNLSKKKNCFRIWREKYRHYLYVLPVISYYFIRWKNRLARLYDERIYMNKLIVRRYFLKWKALLNSKNIIHLLDKRFYIKHAFTVWKNKNTKLTGNNKLNRIADQYYCYSLKRQLFGFLNDLFHRILYFKKASKSLNRLEKNSWFGKWKSKLQLKTITVALQDIAIEHDKQLLCTAMYIWKSKWMKISSQRKDMNRIVGHRYFMKWKVAVRIKRIISTLEKHFCVRYAFSIWKNKKIEATIIEEENNIADRYRSHSLKRQLFILLKDLFQRILRFKAASNLLNCLQKYIWFRKWKNNLVYKRKIQELLDSLQHNQEKKLLRKVVYAWKDLVLREIILKNGYHMIQIKKCKCIMNIWISHYKERMKLKYMQMKISYSLKRKCLLWWRYKRSYYIFHKLYLIRLRRYWNKLRMYVEYQKYKRILIEKEKNRERKNKISKRGKKKKTLHRSSLHNQGPTIEELDLLKLNDINNTQVTKVITNNVIETKVDVNVQQLLQKIERDRFKVLELLEQEKLHDLRSPIPSTPSSIVLNNSEVSENTML